MTHLKQAHFFASFFSCWALSVGCVDGGSRAGVGGQAGFGASGGNAGVGGAAGVGGVAGNGGTGGSGACGELQLELTTPSSVVPEELTGLVRSTVFSLDVICLRLDPGEEEILPPRAFRCHAGAITLLELGVIPSEVFVELVSPDARFRWSGKVAVEELPTAADECPLGRAIVRMTEQPAPSRSVRFALSLAASATSDVYLYRENTRFEGWLRIYDADGNAVPGFDDTWHDQCSSCTGIMNEGNVITDVQTLAPGDRVVQIWDRNWSVLSCWYGLACDMGRPIDAGPHTAKFCWGEASSVEFPHVPVREHCAEIEFVVPTEGESEVEYVVAP